MSVVFRIRAWPRIAATGVAVAVFLAGGGNDEPYGQDYMAGVIADPRFDASVSFTDEGWAARAVPQSGPIAWMPAEPERLDPLTAYYWRDAAIEIDRVKDGVTTRRLTGTIAEATISEDRLIITCADLSNRLDKPFITATFAGTGGIEGGDFAIGRVKRRSFGRVWNVEGRLLDKANSIYEFGDPAFPLQGCTALRDKGRAGSLAILAWQGSIAATFAALQASAPAQGGGVFAPSIACAKWWTQPSGPLTADLQGEASGYAETPARIAAQLLTAVAGPSISNLAAASALRPGQSGLHIGDTSETTAAALDRLFQRVTLIWVLTPTGDIEVRPWTFSAPVEALNATFISRERTVRPVKTQRVGYLKNERVHGDGEISIVVQASDVFFDDGSTVADLNALVGDIETTLDAKRNTFLRETAPSAAESEENDWWVQLDASGKAIATYRRVAGSGRLSIGGNAITLGGSYIELCWALMEDQRITAALTAATAASNLADTKAVVFTMFQSADPVPVGTDFGDVLVRAYLNPVQMDYWNGTAWVPSATFGATAAQAALLTTTATNFNNRNDRIGATPPTPTIAADGSAVDHSINTGGSADISLEWSWGGTESDIDGFEVLVYSSASSSAYVIGAAAEAEQTFFMAANKRAFILYGTEPTRYYTFAVRAYRIVDTDVNVNGIIRSAWVKPSLAAENPYQPAANVAFAGDVTGTVNGLSAGTVASGASAANNGLNGDGTVKTDKVGTTSAVSNAFSSLTVFTVPNSLISGTTVDLVDYTVSKPANTQHVRISCFGKIELSFGASAHAYLYVRGIGPAGLIFGEVLYDKTLGATSDYFYFNFTAVYADADVGNGTHWYLRIDRNLTTYDVRPVFCKMTVEYFKR